MSEQKSGDGAESGAAAREEPGAAGRPVTAEDSGAQGPARAAERPAADEPGTTGADAASDEPGTTGADSPRDEPDLARSDSADDEDDLPGGAPDSAHEADLPGATADSADGESPAAEPDSDWSADDAEDDDTSPSRGNAIAAVVLVVLVVLGAGWYLLSSPQRPEPGDSAALAGADVPAGAPVKAGSSFVQTWRIRNTGQVDWTGRFLQQSSSDGDAECTAPHRVWIPDVAHGGTASVNVPVQTGGKPGRCAITFRMVDENGDEYFPDDALAPVVVDVQVTP